MNLKSLGYRTDLIFPHFDGLILDRGDYLVIRTPANPTFHWGNFLIFPGPPAEGDLERWKTLFTREIGPAEHFSFGWDTVAGELGEVAPFLAEGFDLQESVVLASGAVHRPAKYNDEVVVRPLTEDWEWEQALHNQVECRDAIYGLDGYLVFKRNQMLRYQAMTHAGLGHWFGAFLDGKLVADLGVYASGKLGRFQSVGTHPDYRRQGICGTLVHQASLYALDFMQLETLVMVADEHYHAAKIYKSVGFEPRERQTGLGWWNGSKAGAI